MPKYRRIKEHLKERIAGGDLRNGDRIPSENELAKKFGMSRHTVRQALGSLESEGLIRREQGRGTFCLQGRNGGRTIAVVTTYISEYIFPAVIRGIEEVLSAAGCALVLANTGNDLAREARCLQDALQREIAGFIIEPTKSAREHVNLAYFREMEKRRQPYLMIHAAYDELDPAYIIMDDERGGRMAALYLLQLGHRKIAGLFKADDRQGPRRQAGYTAALAEFGLAPRPEFLGNYETEQMTYFPYQFARDVLRREERPTAFVCYNDQIALQVLEAAREEGLRVPDDLSLVGYDDASLAVATETKLTTIRHPQAEMGRQAAHFILEMLDGRVEKPRLIYPPELIIRASCRGI